MVTREEAQAANQKLIGAAIQASRASRDKIEAARRETFRRLGITFVDDSRSKASGVQAQLSRIGLSDATRRAQQELSEKFGIPTFDVTGLISTVPQTRALDPTIDVGTGILTPESFSDSLRALTKGNDIFQGFANSANELFIKPIIDGFNALFERRSIEDLPPEQQVRARAIETRLKYLESKRVNVPECERKRRFKYMRYARAYWEIYQDCTARDEANKKNHVYDAEIKLLEEELEGLFSRYAVTKNFNDEIGKKVAELQTLLDVDPLTAQVKADIETKLAESSKLIEKILAENIAVTQSNLTELQKRMKVAAFRLHEQVSGKEQGTGDIFKDVGEFFGGIGAQLALVFEELPKAFKEALINATTPSADRVILEYDSQIEAIKRISARQGGKFDKEALEVEQTLKGLAGE